MFNIFGGSNKPSVIKRAIEAAKPTNPPAGPTLGAKAVNERLLKMLKDGKGVHVESFLAILGSFAGFSCQMSLREERIKTGFQTEESLFIQDHGAKST